MWLVRGQDRPHPSEQTLHASPDGVFNYAAAVLNDGLFVLEFRNAIHEGDAQRIVRCWKMMLLYYRSAHRYKYALEALYLIADTNAMLSPRLAQQITCSRVINPHGGAGNNIPIDLHMEHLNRQLKDFTTGIGANLTETTVVNCSKSLQGIAATCENFDATTGIARTSIHHTKKSSKSDEDKIIEEIATKSRVFDYVPGRSHRSFTGINPHVYHSVNADALFSWIRQYRTTLSQTQQFQDMMNT